MSDNAQEWRWVGEDGVEKTVTEQELIAELSSESLPNYTLVWRKGWLEWLPAMQTSELSWALPAGKSDEALRPREKATAAQPPAPPLYRYPVLKRRAANLRTDRTAPGPRGPFTPPRPNSQPDAPASEPSGPTPAIEPPTVELVRPENRPELEPPPPSDPSSFEGPTGPGAREKLPPSRPFEEVDLDTIEASNPTAAEDLTAEVDDDEPASDPKEALEPAPLARAAFTPRAYGEEDDAETRIIPSRPPPPGPLYVGPHIPPTSERPTPPYDVRLTEPAYGEEDEEIPHIPAPRPPPADLAGYVGISGERDAAPPRKPDQKNLYLTVAGTVALGALVGILLFRGMGKDTAAAPPSDDTGAIPSAAPASRALALPGVASTRSMAPAPHGSTCTIVTAATRIADWAEPAITPSFAAIPGSERIAVGFGQSDTYAIGITIDSRTLDRDQVFREFRKQKLVSVVPTVDQDKLHFQVERAGATLDNARAVDASPPFVLGTTSSGVARTVGRGEPESVWSFSETDITVPRVATLPNVGHAVTFRRGGQAGQIAAGWLEPSGKKRTELVNVHASGSVFGTPTISASVDQILIAFAASPEKGAAFSVELATAKAGELPREAVRFAIPPGGPGGSAISPAAAPLPGNRWLLEWTEGSSGNRVVRAQVLGKDLAPLSAPVNLSPDGVNAGQGVVLSQKDAGAVLFYVRNEKKTHELWGTTLDCPK